MFWSIVEQDPELFVYIVDEDPMCLERKLTTELARLFVLAKKYREQGSDPQMSVALATRDILRSLETYNLIDTKTPKLSPQENRRLNRFLKKYTKQQMKSIRAHLRRDISCHSVGAHGNRPQSTENRLGR